MHLGQWHLQKAPPVYVPRYLAPTLEDEPNLADSVEMTVYDADQHLKRWVTAPAAEAPVVPSMATVFGSCFAIVACILRCPAFMSRPDNGAWRRRPCDRVRSAIPN